MLADGRVLIAGGRSAASQPLGTSDLFDPASLAFVAGPALNNARSDFAITQLPDCLTLVSGGSGVTGRLALMEIYTPCTPDNLAPVISVPSTLTAEALSPSGAGVAYVVSAFDDVDGVVPVSCSHASGATFAIGTTTVTCSATDAAGNGASAAFDISVVDSTPPAIATVVPSRATLWAPNHKMKPITLAVDASDQASAFGCRVIPVSSNEAVNGTGDGDVGPDWEITGPLTVSLRAERAGNGTGRIYTVTVACRDAFDNVSKASTTIAVPHDRRR